MKTFTRAFFISLLMAAALAAGAQSPNAATAEARLAKLGFHIFATPQDLPAFSAPLLKGSGVGSASANGSAANASAAPSKLSPESLKGAVTLLNFWATWCPPCKGEMPSIQKLQAAMKGTAFRIAAVSVGEKEKTVADFIAAQGYTFPVYLDGDGSLGQIFASQGIPTTYIVDKKGKVIGGAVGAREYDDSEIISILKELAAR